MMQVQLDLESLSRATGRSFTEAERQEILSVQEASYRWTFIGSGLSHSQFMATFKQVSPAQRVRLLEVAATYCLSLIHI
jgi:hypothetical protein